MVGTDRKGRSFLPYRIREGFLEEVLFKLNFGRGRSQVFGSGEGCQYSPGGI